jgi:PTS system glucose-specific IIC component
VPFFFEAGTFHLIRPPARSFTAKSRVSSPAIRPAGNMTGGYLFQDVGPARRPADRHVARAATREPREVGGIMISAAVTSFLTGITEPIEFAFLFVAARSSTASTPCSPASRISLHRARHQTRLHLLARAHRLLSCSSRNRTALCGCSVPRTDLGRGLLRCLFVRDPPFSICSRPDASGRRSDEALRAVSGDQFALQLIRAFGGRANIVSLDACITDCA